eukprot:417117-Amphidinium_carterae.2
MRAKSSSVGMWNEAGRALIIESGDEPASELAVQGARRASSGTGADVSEAERETASGSKNEAAADSAMGDKDRPKEEVAPLDERALLPTERDGDAFDEGIPPGILFRLGADIVTVGQQQGAKGLWNLSRKKLR